jgi:hypothetical protein
MPQLRAEERDGDRVNYGGSMENPTYNDIATNFRLWEEYVDPHATMTEAEFDDLTVEQRIAMMVECFGLEGADLTTGTLNS